ncbi:hypothetical protein, partial [Fulvivirga aurantia]|uniref:hypothetical protein n=1 Tax=Fulvivirga aurantia TaxID=2529383 RepID=UPI001623CF60
GGQYNSTDQPSYELESTSKVALVPQFGLRANYKVISLGFDIEYVNSQIGNEEILTNLKVLPITFLARIKLLSFSNQTLSISGGFLTPVNMGTSVKSTFSTNSGMASVT